MSKGMSLSAFIEQRFNNKPDAIADFFSSEIKDFLADYGADWEKASKRASFSASEVKLSDSGGLRFAIKQSDHGKIKLWFGAKESAGDKNGNHRNWQPYVTVHNYKIGSETWTAYDSLKDLYDAEQGKIDTARQQQRNQQQAAQQKKRDKIAAERQQRDQQLAEQKQTEHDHYRRLYNEADPEDGSHPYLLKKCISDIARYADIKRMRDPSHDLNGNPYTNENGKLKNLYKNNGEFCALAVTDIDGSYRGLQRLYKNLKLQTVSVNTGFSGGFVLIGDLLSADEIGACEGFATGASVFLAKMQKGINFCMIVAISASNLLKVCQTFKREMPDKQITVFTDNDISKNGNAGLLNGLEISKEIGYKVIYPDFSKIEQQEKPPSDFNDIHCLDPQGLTEVFRQTKAIKNRLKAPKSWFEYCLEKLANASKQKAKRLADNAINAGMGMVPLTLTRRQIFDHVLRYMPANADIKEQYLLDRITWLVRNKIRQANSTRAFSSETLKRANVNHIVIQSETVMHAGKPHQELPSNIMDLINSLSGPVILRAAMGTGKTEKVIKPLINSSPKGLYLAHRISLIGDASKRLEIDNYQLLNASQMPYVKDLACCVNSITNPKFNDFLTGINDICLDEAAQGLHHICEGSSVDNPVKCMSALLDLISNCPGKILMCDADANDALVELCELARPNDTINIIEMETKRTDRSLTHTDYDSAYQLALDALAAGQRVYVPTDSADTAKAMVEQVRRTYPDKNCLAVYSDNKGDAAVEAFLNDPNKEAIKYDLITASPAISSGLSITVNHFDKVIGLLSGVVSPSNAMQMLARIRPALDFTVGLKPRIAKRETDRARIWRGMMRADVDNTDVIETPEEIAIVRKKLPFDELRIRVIADENRAHTDFANHLLLIAAQEGWQVKRKNCTEQFRQQGYENRSIATKEVRQHAINMRLEADDIDDDQAYALSKTEMISEAQTAQLDRYNIRKNLCHDKIDAHDVKFWQNRGLAKLKRFDILRGSKSACDAYDQQQRQHGITVTRRARKVSQWIIIDSLFSMCGIDKETGQGTIDPLGAGKFLEFLTSEQSDNSLSDAPIDRYNQLKLGPYLDPLSRRKRDPIKLIQGILENIGLSTEVKKIGKARLRRRQITAESWQEMLTYYRQRVEQGVWSLEPPTYDDILTGSKTTKPTQSSVEGGAGLPDRVIILTSNPLIRHMPRVIDILDKVTTHISLTRDDVSKWMTRKDWLKIENDLQDDVNHHVVVTSWLQSLCDKACADLGDQYFEGKAS